MGSIVSHQQVLEGKFLDTRNCCMSASLFLIMYVYEVHAARMQDVGTELAGTAPLSVTFDSEKGLTLALSGSFRIQECHVDLENSAKWLSSLRESPLSLCLHSVTLSDWSVLKEDALLFFQECCHEGALCFKEWLLSHLSIALPL